MGERVVEVQALGRRFGRRPALVEVDLEVEPGSIVGLVGPNGSGKTTLLRILAGLLRPSEGTVRVVGRSPWDERHRIMKEVRFAFAPPALFEALTPREHLRALSSLGHGIGASRSQVDEALATVGLLDRADDRVGTFSFGMRQRLVLGQALLPRPRLLVLDEPTEGLDPLAVLELRGVLARLREEHGLAILLSSHLLVEIDRLVDRLVVLREGRALFHGTPEELRRGTRRVVLRADRAEGVETVLRARGWTPTVDRAGAIELPEGSLELEEARSLCREAGAALQGFHVREGTLEEALLERLRQEPRR